VAFRAIFAFLEFEIIGGWVGVEVQQRMEPKRDSVKYNTAMTKITFSKRYDALQIFPIGEMRIALGRSLGIV
jgi:hypothetical protein